MKYWYAFRNGWAGSNIYICELDENFKPTERWAKLDLGKKGSRVGREDPRLFRLNGKLHLSYTGYEGRRTNVLFARINEETLKVEDVFFPKAPDVKGWQKNWAFFDYQGVAHAVYESTPHHRILRIEGDKAEWAFSTPFSPSWSGGYIRGGCAPIMHKENWWHFFHGATYHNKRRLYNMGLIVFRSTPPFDVIAYTPEPIDVADPSVTPKDQYCDVIFPGGAVLVDNKWAIAMGVADRWSEIRFYDCEAVEKMLVDVAPIVP